MLINFSEQNEYGWYKGTLSSYKNALRVMQCNDKACL